MRVANQFSHQLKRASKLFLFFNLSTEMSYSQQFLSTEVKRIVHGCSVPCEFVLLISYYSAYNIPDRLFVGI